MEDIQKQMNKRRKATQRTILKMVEEHTRRGNPWLARRVRRWKIGGNEVYRGQVGGKAEGGEQRPPSQSGIILHLLSVEWAGD